MSLLTRLEKLGLVARPETLTRRGADRLRPATINRDFFVYHGLQLILDGLLTLHPQIGQEVEKVRSFLTDRRLKENWDKPHIKGRRRGH